MTGPAAKERTPLLRPEVMRHRLPGRFGPVAGGTPVSLQLYAVLGLLFLAVLLLYLGVVRFKTTVAASGVLVPGAGAVRAGPAWQGVYHSINVREGESVEAGQVMALISTRRHDEDGRSRSRAEQSFRRREIERLQHRRQLAQQTAETRLRQFSDEQSRLQESLRMLEDEADTMRRRVQARQASLEARESMRERGLLAEITYRQHEERYLALVQQQQQLAGRIIANRQKQEALRDRRHQSRLDQATRDHELESTILRRLHEARLLESDALLAVVAPVAGRAGPVTAREGDVARPGSTLATIIPDATPLQARLYLPGSAMGRVEAGQTVQLTYDAYPYQTHGNHEGTISRVSTTTLDPRHQSLPLPEIREPVYRLEAELPEQTLKADGESHRLRSGMRLRAQIVTAEMTLLAYMFDPLLRLLRKQEVP